jgi:hypothetical protein
MCDISRVLRCAALTLALSMTATLAQAQIQYLTDPTSLGTLSTSTSTTFENISLPVSKLGETFNDYWTFTLPTGSTGGNGSVGGFSLYLKSFPTLLDLTVAIPTLTVTQGGGVFSFTHGTPGGSYTMDISGMTGAGATFGFYGGSIIAVPEPATWALMLAGIAVGAGVARRRLS